MRSTSKKAFVCLCAIASGVLLLRCAPVRASVRSEALYAHGLVPFDNGQWDEAYRLFNEAVQADRSDAVALYYRGLTQARRGQRAAAIQDMEQALKLKSSLPHAPLDLGIAYFDAGQYPKAKMWLERAYRQGPERFAAAFFLGLTAYRLNDDAGATTYLTEAKADPDLRPAAEYYEGLILMRQGKTPAARNAFAQTAREQPQSEVGRIAQRYVAAEEARQPPGAAKTAGGKPWAVFGELGFEYDSNVVIAPSDSAVKSAQGISRESDGRAVIGAGARYTLLDSDTVSLQAEYDFYQSIHFRLTEFDLQGHRVRVNVASKLGPVSYGLAGTYDFYALDYQTFFQEGLGTPWVAFAEGPSATTQVYYTVRGRDFFRKPYDPSRDSINNAVGFRQYVALGSAQRLLSLGYQFDSEDTVANGLGARDFEYNGNQADVDFSFPVLRVAHVDLAYLFRLEDYQFPNSRANFQFRRHDNAHQFVIALGREITPNVSVRLAYLGVINNSNIPDFDYDRHIVSAVLRVTY